MRNSFVLSLVFIGVTLRNKGSLLMAVFRLKLVSLSATNYSYSAPLLTAAITLVATLHT